MNCGLLGKTLKHSFSPQIHSYLGSYSYELFEKEPDALAQFLKNGDFTGLNVTIPYKKDVIPYCDILSDRAKRLGAVNTIVRKDYGTLIGHNTDYFGFLFMVHKMGLSVAGKKVLVLGSGGASVTVVTVLEELGANVVVISRSGANNYTNLYLHKNASAIVNTTPVGMYPNTGISPIDLDLFSHLDGVIDLIYNPAKTKLILDAEMRNIPAINGLWMLIAQAKESSEWFTGKEISDNIIGEIYCKLREQMENIVLIGMPGCGKTTIGLQLSKIICKEFVDADQKIIEKANMPIPEIFEKFGEDGFRQLETEVLYELGKQHGLIIATGGGCVTRNENYPLLCQNGKIFWIQRDLSSLATDGRPLSKSGKLEQMYAVRKPMYEQFADRIIENNGTIESVISEILKG